LLHNIKHNQVLHERVVILTVQIEEVPHYPAEKRAESGRLARASTGSSCAMVSWMK
jgi:K+ transporter